MIALRYAAEHLRLGGVFLQFTSISATQPTEMTSSYAPFKAGLEQALRIAAIEYGNHIRVLGVALGIVITPMTAFLDSEFGHSVVKRVTPLGRMIELDDIVAAVRFLVSNDCFETSYIMPVTGGAIITRALKAKDFYPD